METMSEIRMSEEMRDRLQRELRAYNAACRTNDVDGILTHSEAPMNYLINLLASEGIIAYSEVMQP